MNYSNKYNLPDAFVRACVNDPYSRGKSDFSATSLAEPARAQALKHQFNDDIVIDVSSKVASIIGQGAHHVAERAARPGIDLCEKRFFAKFLVDGMTFTVSAQIDLYEGDTKTIFDWKTTKAYAFSKKAGGGQKPEWQAQLNVAAEIMRRENYGVLGLGVIALLKDWNKREAGTPGMPEAEVLSVPIALWEREKTVAYIEARIRAHVAAKLELPKCSSGETWAGRRCADWCDASSVCTQFQESKRTGLLNEQV